MSVATQDLAAMEAIGHIKIKVKTKTGYVYALVDDDYDGEMFSHYKWYLSPIGYATRREYRDGKKSTVYLHHEVLSVVPAGYWRDHINRNKLDNRSCNLRPVTPRMSAANRAMGKRVPNQLGYRGVSKIIIVRNGVRFHYGTFGAYCAGKLVGTFRSPEEAARAYDKAALDRWGDLATLNFPRTAQASLPL